MLKSRHNKKSFTAINFAFEYWKQILPAVVSSMPSEEPSIIKSLEQLSDAIMNTNWNYSLFIKVGGVVSPVY